MHESFFGLQKRPFLTVPTLERYFPVASQEQAFQACHRAISRAEGPVAILGGTGLGKSMVCLRIADVFRRAYEVIMLSSSQICSRRALLQSLLFELRMPYRDLNEGELRLSLMDRLQLSSENPSDGLVLIVDEAQSLSIKLLEELRMLTNLSRDGVPRVRLVLCGSHRLDEMLSHPQLESLNQRLAGRCYLTPLNTQETLAYLTHKIERCGAPIQAVLTDEAMVLIHRATDGVPRLIDQLADQTLRLAAEAHQRPCSAATVESAWAGLQQLPLPWSDAGSPIVANEASIEFGTLDEDQEHEFSVPELHATTQAALNQWEAHPAAITPGLTSSRFDVVEPKNSNAYAPVPLSGEEFDEFAALESETVEPNYPENLAGDDPWESFLASPVSQSPLVGELFGEDYFSTPDRILPTPWLPETVEFFPSTPKQPIHDAPAMPATNATPSRDILFGDDFEEEQALDNAPSPSTQDYLAYQGDALTNMASPSESLAFDASLIPTFEHDESLQPYTELLDSLSSVNMEAMTFDPSVTLRSVNEPYASKPQSIAYEGSLANQSRDGIISFSTLQQTANPAISDDRDLLVIEEDLPLQTPAAQAEPITQAVVHPYKQLFSKLRG